MSDEDVLARALSDLRETTDGAHAHASRTRTRILTRAGDQARRRRRAVFLVVPLAAAFLVSAAWGAVTGRLSRWLDVVTRHAATPSTTPAAPRESPPERPTPPGATAAPPPAYSGPTVEATTPPPPEAAASDTLSPPRPRTWAAPSSSKQASREVSAREQALYEAAHTAHFVDRDPAAALRAWDAYLAAYPAGRFALEARYNRAISLVRLGRRDEARDALGPFARGEYGGYRQHEARALLDALGAGESGPSPP